MKRIHEPDHLAFIRILPCLICRNDICTEAAHIRYSDAKYSKVNPGVGAKPDDKYTVPLCNKHHREQHGMNEPEFWHGYGIDPIKVALELHERTGDIEAAMKVIDGQARTVEFG